MIPSRLRVLIVDDEPLARRALRALVSDVPSLEYTGECGDGASALKLIAELRPDVVFLDIQMPEMSGLDVVAGIGDDVAVIFTTAFDEYAVTAFELGAIDYLRKPFGAPRFLKAVNRAAQQIEARRGRSAASAPGIPLNERLAFAKAPQNPLQRIFVRDRGAVIPIDVGTIARFEGDGDFAGVFAGGRRYLVHIKLRDLEAKLDPAHFVRIHRSHIVNLSAVKSIGAADPSRLQVLLSDGTSIVASRTGTTLLRRAMRYGTQTK